MATDAAKEFLTFPVLNYTDLWMFLGTLDIGISLRFLLLNFGERKAFIGAHDVGLIGAGYFGPLSEKNPIGPFTSDASPGEFGSGLGAIADRLTRLLGPRGATLVSFTGD